MKRRTLRVLTGVAVTALAVSTLQIPAQAANAPTDRDPAAAQAKKSDDLKSQLSDKQRALRETAVQQVIKGTAKIETKGGQQVINVGKGQYVQYAVNREESIFTILSDFGTATKPATGGSGGPLNNQIVAPDRNWDGNATDDNSTYWINDFNKGHYQDLMFGAGESFKDFYLKQSNGKFLAKGDVSDWVTVPYNEASYGSNAISDSAGYWPFVEDTATAWYDAQVAAGKTEAEIKAYLAQFDKVDRYDYNGNGNFNEPDGYIDHFQAIHAGEGEEAGGGLQGPDAIWSHRWYVNSTDYGYTGPSDNPAGGTQIGNTGMWIGDYTTEPENGGLGVFTHEFGHDLGLPDLYDTAGGDNGTGFWTLMSGGSWLNHGTDSIGTTPGYMGPWEKLQLGWLGYKQVNYGANAQVKLGPADRAGKTPQAILVNLPDKTVKTDYNTPHSGAFEWWGGSADNLNTTLSRTVDLRAGTASATVSAWAKYDMEAGYDYLYGEVSTDGGTSWTQVGTKIDGSSDWKQISYDLSGYVGQSVQFRFRYATDGGVHYDGPFLDDLAVTVDGASTFTDDVESGVNGWTADGFTRMGGSTNLVVPQFYLAENRVYSGYDTTLQTGPYNFGFGNTRPDWVERFPYQNGLLVWYSDGACTDNNTISHPGCGQSLPVDARPAPVMFPGGFRLGNRRQPFDATFGQEATDAVTFHRLGVATVVASQPAIPTFDDSDPNRYWSTLNPMASTKVAGTGTSISVVDTSKQGDQMIVNVAFKK
ncbi:MAG TPA: immune inhibitor A domain-containing protein [Dermatophilaceae bacterium]